MSGSIIDATDTTSATVPLLDAVRRAAWPVRSQGESGTCVAQAVAACLELLLSRRSGADIAPPLTSPTFLYRQVRDRSWDSLPEKWDRGAIKLGQAAAVLNGVGICTDTSWPDWTDIARPTDDAILAEAAAWRCRTVAYADKPTTTDWPSKPSDWVAAQLLNRRPVAIALGSPREDWWGVARTAGTLPAPRSTQPGGDGHAVCILGMMPNPSSPTQRLFQFRNSWSLSWGDQGYGIMPEAYLNAYTWEMLVIEPLASPAPVTLP